MSTQPSAKIICHSINPLGEELITMEIECHRFILPEFNTHRTFSRNFQSSRAIPVKRMTEMIRNDPAYPVHWGKNQAGMQAYEECNNMVLFNDGKTAGGSRAAWYEAMLNACDMAEAFDKAGYHKQIVNRLVEPFMWQKGVVTATREAYEAFFTLRSHHAAQPEIKALSDAMREALAASTPNQLNWGEWHMPYVEVKYEQLIAAHIGTRGAQRFYSEDGGLLTLEQALKVSASCCGQVSYRRLDDSLEKAERIYDLLNLDAFNNDDLDPPHASPCEHSAKAEQGGLCGNLTGDWTQYRKLLELGLDINKNIGE